MPNALSIYVSEIDPAGTVLAVSLVGEADIETAPVLRGCLLRLLNRWRAPIVLDLSHLEFIDSTGIGALVSGYQRASQYGCRICAAALTSQAAKVFDLAALETIIPAYRSVTEACEKQFHLDGPIVRRAPVPIETFLMRRKRIDCEDAPVSAQPNAAPPQRAR